ncbi:Aminotransferase class-III [Cordyceps fumosorosea ARSEF 2679]|uniref:Aminotransferase class-III n=1 Tax=Cordyceps fumosorosea (strain ARSEF 2679) TaxID=1081104 RepID=A0A168DCM1_CORFA|nr:Aminotransferase class-III [Cordyceps fumosorosea ARSEF 2679]OAA72441.1 Aminotransferase class-III [Cordyceps fumosorosea ARSEF 2679]
MAAGNDMTNGTQINAAHDESHVLHNSLVSKPPTVASASGSYITMSTGQRVLDACGGAAVTIIGHNDPDVNAAVAEQMTKVCYTHTVAFTTNAAEELADYILGENPHGLTRAFFVCSGSEAMDSALKLARQYYVEIGQPERTHIVSRHRAYHGNTVGAMSVGSHVSRRAPFEEALMLDNVSFVSPTYAYRHQLPDEEEEEYAARLVEELDQHFQAKGPGTVMAFISEPVGGATAGCLTAPKGYYQGVRRVCDKYGILLILDEVMCGSGRTGTYFAFEQEGEGMYPDLITMGKGLGGGFAPMGAVLAHDKVIKGFQKGSAWFVHSHTYQAHGVGCAAALAVQKVLRRDQLVERCAAKGKWLHEALVTTFGDRKYVGNIRGKGLFWGIEFVKDKMTKESFEPSLRFTWLIVDEALRRGLSVYPGAATADGFKGDHIIIAPPYNMSDEEFDEMLRLLKDTYDMVEKQVEALADGK